MAGTVSARAALITRSRYNRPVNEDETRFETWDHTSDRVINHQRWLWERAQEGSLTAAQSAELEELRRLMLDRRTMPAGRVLWMGGTDIVKSRESSSFNCAFTEVSTIHDAVDVFWLLLQGCGVGFRPCPGRLTGFYQKLDVEVIRSQRTGKGGDEQNRETFDQATRTWTIRVGDSAEAWAKSIGKLLFHAYAAKKLVLDFSQLRPAGIRLRGYGWVSSGDANLAEAYTAIVAILNRRAGRLLTKQDIWDVVNWLGTVLSSRRSAQIGIIDDGDSEAGAVAARKYAGFDTGPDWYRGQSNNTLVFHSKPTTRRLRQIFEQMYAQGGSEPGFCNAAEALRRAPWFKGPNPCVTGDTWVMTDKGPRRAYDLVGIPFKAMVDGKPHDSTDRGFFLTGHKPVFRVETDRGYTFDCTGDHKILAITHMSQKARRTAWKSLSELAIGDRISLHNHRGVEWDGEGTFEQGWLVGSLLGDGTFGLSGKTYTALLNYWGPSKFVMREMAASMMRQSVSVRSDFGTGGEKSWSAAAQDKVVIHSVGLRDLAFAYGVDCEKTIDEDQIESSSSDFCRGFLSGWFDADGGVQGNQQKGVSVRLTSVSEHNLKIAQRMLSRLGIASTIYRNRLPAGIRDLPDGKGGTRGFECQAVHELVIAGSNVREYAERIGFLEPAKSMRLRSLLGNYKRKLNRERFTAKIRSVTLLGVRPVYDCTIPTASQFDANGVNVHNCFEILLGSFCNLTETDVAAYRNDDRGLHDALHLIARANYRQTCVNLRDGILQSHWHEQNAYLRLCGVGLCGVTRRDDLTAYDYKQMKYAAVYGAYSMADELGTPRPKNTTCVKPGGTVPKIMDTTEGIKRPDGRYILNRVNFRRSDPLLSRIIDAGYRVEDHPSVSDSCLVVLPIEYPDVSFGRHADGTPINTESAVSQLDRYKFIMDHYCEQNASTTIMWSPEEIPAMVRWFDRNWDSIVGVSFCLRNDHTKTAADLGYAYLPQSVVREEDFRRYSQGIRPIDLDGVGDRDALDALEIAECSGGMCPTR